MVSFTWTQGIPEGAKIIRSTVFVEEQGFAIEDEFDELDGSSWHIVLYEQGAPLATGRLIRETPTIFHLGRIAVNRASRKKGFGFTLMHLMERKALSLGAEQLQLGAQIQAKGFYEKCGFYAVGNEYMDCHVPHIEMVKDLDHSISKEGLPLPQSEATI